MNKLVRFAIVICLIAMVSMVGSVLAQSVTISATIPQILNIDFPSTSNFGQLNPNNPATIQNQIHVSGNSNWGLSVYPSDDGYGHHGYLVQQSTNSMHDYIRTPVSFGLISPYYGMTSDLENYYSYSPLQIMSGSGDTSMTYQLSTQASGVENARYPYSITLDFILNAQ